MLESFIQSYAGTLARSDHDRVRAALESAWSRARQDRDLEVSRADLVRYLAERAPERDLLAWLEQVPAGDLYLACGCASGGEAAIAAFLTAHEPAIERALSRLRLTDTQRDEVVSRVRTRLLVGDPPAITKYSGTGPLAAWVGTVAAREGISYLRALDHDSAPAGDDLADPLQADPELQYLKATYRAAFRSAFAAALDALAPRERTLLKYQYLDGLTSRKIGKIYGVHHATAARWVQAARTSLLEHTREALMGALSIDASELDSVMRLIQSRWDVTVRRLLSPEGGDS